MNKSSTSAVAVLSVLVALTGPSSAQNQQPDRVHVITSGGFTAAFNILGPVFEEASGIEIDLEYGSSMGGGPESIPVRLERGERFDVLIFNGSAFDGVASTGGILPERSSRSWSFSRWRGRSQRCAETRHQHARSIYRGATGRRVHRVLGERKRHLSFDRHVPVARDLG